MTHPTDPQAAYEGAPDLRTEEAALEALAASLTGPARTAAALRVLVLRKAAWLDRAAMIRADDARAQLLAAYGARDLVSHDRAFGERTGPAADDIEARAYVRQEYAAYRSAVSI
ncbi:MAG: hypothetical protein ACREOE_03100 [Gemmatimonadales bacterium]